MENNNREKIAERLSDEMHYSGMSLTKIASKLGISASIVAMYRNKKRLPSLESFAQLCKILDVSADYILGNH